MITLFDFLWLFDWDVMYLLNVNEFSVIKSIYGNVIFINKHRNMKNDLITQARLPTWQSRFSK